MTRAVLTFHGVDDSDSVLSYPTRAFGELLGQVLRDGIPILSFEALETAATGIAITFDDGMRSVATNALPVLRDLGVPSHLFLTTGRVGADNRWPSQPTHVAAMPMLDWAEVESCAAAGMSIECHTATHPDLRQLAPAAIVAECAAADEVIERHVGRRPRLFAYPYGHVSDAAREVAASRYDAAFTAELDYLPAKCDAHLVPRIDAYYLRSPQIARRFMTGPGRAYMSLRSALRRLKRLA